MLFQSPKNLSKNLVNDNIFPSQSLFLNQNYNSYFNNNSHYSNKFLTETPLQINMFSNSFNKDYNNTEKSFNKDMHYKDVSSSKAEIKNSSNNLCNLINTPQFEKICYKIFFPQDDPFHLSSTKKSPNKNDIKNNFKTSLFVENDSKKNVNNNNNNSNYNQSTKRKNNFDLESSQSKKNKIKSYSYSSSNSKSSDKQINNYKNIKNKKSLNRNNNLNKIHRKNNRSICKLPIKKTKKFTAELRALFKNETNEFYEQITSASSTKTRSSITSETKMKNRKKIISKTTNVNFQNVNHTRRSKKYNILSEETKRKLLADAKNMKTIDVARKYGISTRNINRWKKIGIKRKKGSGRKFKDPGLEKKILIWYNTQDKKNITSKEFKNKALELSNNKSFRASSGWLTTMKKKYRIKFKHK